MPTYEDVRLSDDEYSHISLVKLFGRPIKDIECDITAEFDMFNVQLRYVVFEDGTEVKVQADSPRIAYLPAYGGQPELKQSVLGPIYNAMNGASEPGDEDWIAWDPDD